MKDIDFVHLSDTHLGYRQYGLDGRFKDWGRATRQVIDYAVDHDVDAVIHSGDLFNSAKPGRDALLQATQIFEPLKERGIPFLVIKGNHDRERGKQRCGAIDVLDRLKYCELLDPSGKDISEAVYKLNGYNFIGLGYPGTDLEGWIDDLSEKLPEKRDNIVLLHAGVEGHFERWAPHITLEELKKLKEKNHLSRPGPLPRFIQAGQLGFQPRERREREDRTAAEPKNILSCGDGGEERECDRDRD
ncbi:hypothetical protein AKJ41_03510 [candidate division MSBL1 archaeon SCGC-AAA259O05]|uniref:Calcineurin-like phosphoesterase domain-containing protein n=2 Tax=candidate division MSBL1 TaxID=215777 RepID=A0A133V396_9EURY|nr:hypothetical protein AKJ64_01825 [candidate division MSBL1 archaeon SCGC-AAA259E17]KXB00905.1 hypothetical protein AKJ41_03510 [candidate division MSBL1 archaeon SCGC-AAA259O05]